MAAWFLRAGRGQREESLYDRAIGTLAPVEWWW